jgi:hypothetical protein
LTSGIVRHSYSVQGLFTTHGVEITLDLDTADICLTGKHGALVKAPLIVYVRNTFNSGTGFKSGVQRALLERPEILIRFLLTSQNRSFARSRDLHLRPRWEAKATQHY